MFVYFILRVVNLCFCGTYLQTRFVDRNAQRFNLKLDLIYFGVQFFYFVLKGLGLILGTFYLFFIFVNLLLNFFYLFVSGIYFILDRTKRHHRWQAEKKS